MNDVTRTKDPKRPRLMMEATDDITAFLRGGLIVVRSVSTLNEVSLSQYEAVAVAKWILENFE